MTDDFHDRLSATLNYIPELPTRMATKVPRPRKPANFLWYVFSTDSPSPDDIRCAKQALRRCLQADNGLGWLIWDQVAGWRPPAPVLAGDMRRLVKAHPPWEIRDSAEQRRRENARNNRARDVTIDQSLVAAMQSRIKQWLSKCYGRPLSNPRWEELIRHTNANKASRLKIMEKAVAGKLIPEITLAMTRTLARAQEHAQEQTQQSRDAAQRRRAKRAQRQQQAGEEAWQAHRQRNQGIE